MAKPKISEVEKNALRTAAKDELLRMEKILDDHAIIQTVDLFKNKFNTCETVYKVILAEHQRNTNKKVEKKKLKIDMRQVPHALKFAGYTFDNKLLNLLFAGRDVQGKKSAKELRNAVTHGMDEKAVSEIMTRKKELFGYMDSFLSVIRDFDNQGTYNMNN